MAPHGCRRYRAEKLAERGQLPLDRPGEEMVGRLNRLSTFVGLVVLLLLPASQAGAEPSLRVEAGATAHHGEGMASEPGFMFGGSLALARWAPSEHLALVPHLELLFARRNTSLTVAGVEQAPLSMDSLELPLLLRGEAKLGGRTFYALGGGYAGLVLRAQSMKHDGVVDRADTATSTDFGVLVGAGFELTSLSWGELFVEMRYQRSQRAVLADGESNPELFSVLLGYGLGSQASSSTSSWTKNRSLALKGGLVAARMFGETGSAYGPGISFGAAFSPARLGSRVALAPQFEVLFVHRNTESDRPDRDSMALDSMESAVLARAEVSFSRRTIYGVGGAYASALLRAQRTRDGVTTDARGALRSLDFGWLAGAGVEFDAATRTRLALEVRYQRSLRAHAATALQPGSPDALFCLIGVTHGGARGPRSGPATAHEHDTVGALYSSADGSEGAATQKSSGLRVADRTVLIGRPGDRWLHTMQFTSVARDTEEGVNGYLVIYEVSGHGVVEIFWPREAIDFSNRSGGSLLDTIDLDEGRLRYPMVITRRSLPKVHDAILEIEAEYAKQANGVISAMEGFAVVASLGGLRPTLRVTSSTTPRPVNVRKPGRTVTRRVVKGKAGKGKAGKGKAGKSKAGKSKSKAGKAASQIKGRWVREPPPASARAAEYQTRFGRRGQAYRVNGVNFDGVANGVLLEAKGPGYANFVKNGVFRKWFMRKGGKELLDQAHRQIQAAGGVAIHWHFAEEAAAMATRALFHKEGISKISIFFTP